MRNGALSDYLQSTSEVFHQPFVLSLVCIRIFPLEVCLLCCFVDRFIVSDFVVGRLEIIRRRHFPVSLGPFVVLHETHLTKSCANIEV